MIQIESIPKWLRDNGRFVLRRGKIPYTKDGRADIFSKHVKFDIFESIKFPGVHF